MNSHSFASPGWTILALLAVATIALLAPLRVPLGSRASDNPRILRALTIPGTLVVAWLLAAATLPASTSTGLHVSSHLAVFGGLVLVAAVAGFATWGDDDRGARGLPLRIWRAVAVVALILVLVLAVIQAGTPQPA